MSRGDAVLGSIASLVLLGVALYAALGSPTDPLVVGALIVVLAVALPGLGMTLYRLLH
jgi:hypothetical protein